MIIDFGKNVFTVKKDNKKTYKYTINFVQIKINAKWILREYL